MWAAKVITKKTIPLLRKNNICRENGRNVIPIEFDIIEENTSITITKGKDCKYAIWSHYGIYDLPEEFIDETTIKQFAE